MTGVMCRAGDGDVELWWVTLPLRSKELHHFDISSYAGAHSLREADQ